MILDVSRPSPKLTKSGMGLALPRPGLRMKVRTFPRSGWPRDIGSKRLRFYSAEDLDGGVSIYMGPV